MTVLLLEAVEAFTIDEPRSGFAVFFAVGPLDVQPGDLFLATERVHTQTRFHYYRRDRTLGTPRRQQNYILCRDGVRLTDVERLKCKAPELVQR